jgi:uncharacterized protein (TIGR02246 family)
MTRYTRLALLVAAASAVAACSNQPAPVNTAAEMPKIDALRTQFLTAFNAGDATGVIGGYTDDAAMLPPDHEPVVGKAAILAYYQGFFAQFSAHSELTPADTKVLDNDWGYERGGSTVTLTPKAGGAPITSTGKYLVIFRKQPDGSWKVAEDIHNSNAPPPSPSGAGK